MLFGGAKGFNAFFPHLIKENSYVPPIVLTNFQLFNKSMAVGPNSP